MKPLVYVPVGADEVFLVEVDGPPEGIGRVARPGEVVATLSDTFDDALGRLRGLAERLRAEFAEAADAPDEVDVELGLKVHATAGLVVAHTSGEANFRLTLRWRRQQSIADVTC